MIILLLLLVLSICVYKVMSAYLARENHTWLCGYCDYRGSARDVIYHAHENHQRLLDMEN